MAIKDFYPAIRPTLDLNFAASRIVDPRITFSRSGTGNVASYFDEKGAMIFARPNVPRISFDSVTGECSGLLMELQRTNLLTYSAQFDNAGWGKTNSTVTANIVIAPDGTMTADKLVENSVNSVHNIANYSISVVSGTAYTLSVFAKSGERASIRLRFSSYNSAWGEQNAIFNLASGTVTGTQNVSSYSISSVGSGWYRCSVTASASSTAAGAVTLDLYNGGTNYTGDGISGLYIWGAQLETGNATTSYIPTTTSQVTCSADTASMSGANFSSWYNTTGTILAKYKKSGWKHNNTPPSTQLDLSKYIQDYSTPVVSDAIERIMFYPRQLTEEQISALKG